jgi:hypothetical protein
MPAEPPSIPDAAASSSPEPGCPGLNAQLVLLLNVGAASIKSAVLPTHGPVLQAAPLWRGSAPELGGEGAVWRDSSGTAMRLPGAPAAFAAAGDHLLLQRAQLVPASAGKGGA